MVDVDGVLVDGRPEDGRHWQTSIADALGIDAATLHEQFFVPYWEDIVLGRVGLMEHLTTALRRIAPHVNRAGGRLVQRALDSDYCAAATVDT
jgi:putative hydrolase of the HAD superfamily